MRGLGDVADARRERAGIRAAKRDNLEPCVEPDQAADERRDVAPDTGRW